MGKTIIRKKAFVDTNYCIACGMCAKNCPLNAISIYKGIYAKVDFNKCVGCGKCSNVCPASIIEIKEEIDNNE